MATLRSRCGQWHYIFALWFLSFFLFLFSSPNLSGRRLNIYHIFYTWCDLTALECRSEMCCTWLAGSTGRKWRKKIAICAPSPQFVRLSSPLRHVLTIGQKTSWTAISPRHVVTIWWTSRERYGDWRHVVAGCTALVTRMWANAQRDGRPAEHRWRLPFNAAKLGWRPLLDAVQ